MNLKPADGDWDKVIQVSTGAWFWHTRAWLDYSREYAAAGFVRDASFYVMDGGAHLAAVPVFVERWDGRPTLSLARGPLPAPACVRPDAFETALEGLKELARKEGVDRFQLRVPSLAPAVLESALPCSSPFLRHGGLDLPFQTQLVDLRKPLSELWSDVRHGFRADIRRAEKTMAARAWWGEELTDAKFKEYQYLHAKDAGRVTRPQATFDLMRDWCRQRRGVLIETSEAGKPVAFALLLLHGSGALYGSACKDPDKPKLPSMHLAQWTAVKWLKEESFRFYDLGQQDFSAQWFHSPSPKEVAISLFKRGLGGTTAPVFTAEFYLTPGGMRSAVLERLERNLPA